MVKSKKDDKIKFANWEYFFQQFYPKIIELTEIAQTGYFALEGVLIYYAKLKKFSVISKNYVEDYNNIKEKIDMVGSKLFDDKFLRLTEDKRNNSNIKRIVFESIVILDRQLERIIDGFVECGLMPTAKQVSDMPFAINTEIKQK